MTKWSYYYAKPYLNFNNNPLIYVYRFSPDSVDHYRYSTGNDSWDGVLDTPSPANRSLYFYNLQELVFHMQNDVEVEPIDKQIYLRALI